LALDRPRILGIVNVTPDSFSDGGRLRTLDEARRHVERLIAEGADVVDIGGESTRPQGARTVDAEEEQRRVVPLVQAVRRDHPAVPISVDTTKAAVARTSLEAGASIVNDVSAFPARRCDGSRLRCRGCGVVLMHSRGDVATMATYAHATYGDDPVGEVIAELRAAVGGAQTSASRRPDRPGSGHRIRQAKRDVYRDVVRALGSSRWDIRFSSARRASGSSARSRAARSRANASAGRSARTSRRSSVARGSFACTT
jgi:dihydropteroate synthase